MSGVGRSGWCGAGLFACAAAGGLLAWSPPVRAQEVEVVEVPPEFTLLTPRARLGVYVQAADDGDGLVVDRVSNGGPAEEAGILAGDIILSVDGHALVEPLEDESGRGPWSMTRRLRALVGEAAEDQPVTVGIERDGERLELEVVPEVVDGAREFMVRMESAGARALRSWEEAREEWEDAREQREETWQEAREQWEETWEEAREQWEEAREQARERGEKAREDARQVREQVDEARRQRRYRDGDFPAGITVRGDFPGMVFQGVLPSRLDGIELVEVNPDLGAYFGTDRGVLVVDADEDSPLGLRAGDVVVRVGDLSVNDVSRLRDVLRLYEDEEEVTLHIWRDGEETTIVGFVNRQ